MFQKTGKTTTLGVMKPEDPGKKKEAEAKPATTENQKTKTEQQNK